VDFSKMAQLLLMLEHAQPWVKMCLKWVATLSMQQLQLFYATEVRNTIKVSLKY